MGDGMIGKTFKTPVTDFTFVHISDEHVFHEGPERAIREIGELRRVEMSPYKTLADQPSFVIDTGDCTEFGVRGGAYDVLCSYFAKANITHHLAVGNHDQTWGSVAPEMRREHGATYYSFDSHGIHFVILETASLQDPRPSISPEELTWLQNDLAKVGSDCPVIMGFHHPLNGSEFASSFDVDRLLDLIHPYNIVLMLVGHGHTAEHSVFSGIDTLQGGCPWGGQPGYQIISIRNGMLRVAYKLLGEAAATIPMLEKPLMAAIPPYPQITIDSPKINETLKQTLRVRVQIAGVKSDSAVAEIDGSMNIALKPASGGWYEADIPLTNMQAGAHTLRCLFKCKDDSSYQRSGCFYSESPDMDVLWRANLGAASKSTPAITRDAVLVGDNSGMFHAIDHRNGKELWHYQSGGAIVGEPLIQANRVIFGSDDGTLTALSLTDGSLMWNYISGDPIYSSAVSDGRLAYFGCRSGAFYAIDVNTGLKVWCNNSATYCIEAKPFITGGRVIFGAWDCYIYCVDCRTGDLAWKCMCKGSAEGIAPAYYSASDAVPVQCGSRVFVADRKYRLSIINARNGKLIESQSSVASVALSADGRYVYTRGTNSKLSKLDVNGRQLWSVDAPTDSLPTTPYESEGVVYLASGKGLVCAVDAMTGRILWKYQATSRMFMFAGVSADSRTAYAVGSDGIVTALRPKR